MTSRGQTRIAVGVVSLLAATLLWFNPATDLAAAGIGAERVEQAAKVNTDPAQVLVQPAAPERCS